MNRLITGLFLAVVIAGIGGFAATTERTSAQQRGLDCTAGDVVEGIGNVSCTLTVTDLPEPLGDFTLKLDITYNDVDGDGGPSAGDRIKCVAVSGTTPSGQTIGSNRCRSEIATPTAVPTATPTAVSPTATPTVTPTATDVPPTATDVPPTATDVPPTATEVPPTPTDVP